MSRFRSPPREAPRHTGDLWGRGAEYRFDRYQVLQLGPWARFTDREVPVDIQGAIVDTSGVFLVQRGLLSMVLQDVDDLTVPVGETLLGVFDMRLGGTRYRVTFTDVENPEDASERIIRLRLHDGTTEEVFTSEQGWVEGNPAGASPRSDHAQKLISSGEPVYAIPWGEDIYFGQKDQVSQVYEDPTQSIVDGTVFNGGYWFRKDKGEFRRTPMRGLSGSEADAYMPAVEIVNILQNTLVANTADADEELDGTRYQVIWSEDGSPKLLFPGVTFSGVNGGNNPVHGFHGRIQGLEEVSGTIMIITEGGAVVMTPTGTLPEFRFKRNDGIKGTPIFGATASSGTTLFYLGHDGMIRFSQGGPGQVLGAEPPRFDVHASFTMDYLKGLNLIRANDYLIDPDSLEFVGKISTSGDILFSTTSLYPGEDFDVLYVYTATGGDAYRYTGDVDSAISATARFPDIDFGDEYEVLYVDVVTTSTDYLDNSQLSVVVRQSDGTEETVVGTLTDDFGVVQRWSVHVVGQVMRILLSAESTLRNPWDGIKNLYVIGKPPSEEGAARLRV